MSESRCANKSIPIVKRKTNLIEDDDEEHVADDPIEIFDIKNQSKNK